MFAIFAAAGFDFVDGLAARALNVCSPTGKDLDSLSDMVSFGVAPGMMLFNFLDRMQREVAWSSPACGKAFLAVAFAIPVFSALRLARFNNDTRQRESFIGLPVPAHAIFWASLLYELATPVSHTLFQGFLSLDAPSFLLRIPPVTALALLVAMAAGSSLLLVSNIPMFSFKVKSFRWTENRKRYAFLLAAVGLLICCGIGGLCMSVALYVLLAVYNRRR
jgi:CDP-diacylglycerol--serine O-phosphatidyltransferase